MKTFFSKTWMLWAYIAIEVAFQLYLRHNLQHIQNLRVERLEMISRLLFAMSTMVFLWSGLQIRHFVIVPISGIIAFFMAAQVYPAIHARLSPDVQAQMLNKFVWGASKGVFSNPEHLNTAMTLAFSAYDAQGQSIADKVKGNDFQFYYHFTTKVLPEAMRKGAKLVHPRDKTEQRHRMEEISAPDSWLAIEQNPRGRDFFLMRAVVKKVNERLSEVISTKTGLSITNREPLGTTIKMSEAIINPELFKQQFNEWLLTEWLVNKGIYGGKEFALKALIMLPLGFFFSALGILLNLSAIVIKGTSGISQVPRPLAYGLVAIMWITTIWYGLSAIPPAMADVQGVYWLTPVFAVTKALGMVAL